MLPLLEPRLYQTHSLRTFWIMLVPWPALSLALYLATALLISVLTVACWRSRLSLSLRYSALLLATVLLAPHLTVYDLVILAPAFLLLSDWIVSQTDDYDIRPFKLLLYLAFILPLLGPLARWTHVQLSVPVMATLLYGIWNLSRKSVPPVNCRFRTSVSCAVRAWPEGSRRQSGQSGAKQPALSEAEGSRFLRNNNRALGSLPHQTALLPKQKLQRLREPLRPRRLVVPSSILDHQPQPSFTEHGSTHDGRQFPHIVHYGPAPLRASCLGSSRLPQIFSPAKFSPTGSPG